MPCKEVFDNMSNELTVTTTDYHCPESLREELSKNCKNVLIVDCRSQSEYTRSHVRGAINITLPSLMLKRLKRGNLNISSVIQNNEAKERFTKNSKNSTIILYDDCSTDLNVNPSGVINLLVKKLKQDGCCASFLLGGFSTFVQRYPEYCQQDHDSVIMGLCNLRISEEPKNIDNNTTSTCSTASPIACPHPVEVLKNLYLGCAKNSADLHQLKHYGITYILNVTTNVPNTFEDEENFKYLQIPISDHWSQNLASFFPEAIKFIDEARNNQTGVLVHCLAGISRSVTVIVAYLMSRGMSLNTAYDHVKICKPNISPNFTFMGQLLDFERDIHDKCTDSSEEGLISDSEKLSSISSNSPTGSSSPISSSPTGSSSPTSSNCSPI